MISDEDRVPLIDLRRIERYGRCRGRLPIRCSKTSLRDDIHFPSCPQASHSDSPPGTLRQTAPTPTP